MYKMDHPNVIVCSCMENTIGRKRVENIHVQLSIATITLVYCTEYYVLCLYGCIDLLDISVLPQEVIMELIWKYFHVLLNIFIT